jgi:hypothetical protein
VLPGKLVAEQEPGFIAWVGRRPMTPLSKNISRKGPLTQISPLRCAPVEMTKGRAVLPAKLVAKQEPGFITLGGPKARDSSVEKHFQERPANADLSTTLRSGRDDKGEGGASGESGGRTGARFHHLGGRRPMTPLSKKTRSQKQDLGHPRTFAPASILRACIRLEQRRRQMRLSLPTTGDACLSMPGGRIIASSMSWLNISSRGWKPDWQMEDTSAG